MAKSKRSKLEPRENIRARLLYAEGYEPTEIAEMLGCGLRPVQLLCEWEDIHREKARSTLDRLHRQRRSVEIRRNECIEMLHRLRIVLPDKISGNGHQERHIGLHRQFFDLSARVSRFDEVLARIDDQIAKADGTYRELGSDRPATRVVLIPGERTDPGDLPVEGQVSRDDRDGDSSEDDADQ